MRRLVCVALKISLTLIAPFLPAIAGAAGPALYFAAGYRTDLPTPQNIVELGVVYQCGPQWCIDTQSFAGNDNTATTPTVFRHRMAAPFRDPKCMDGPLMTVTGRVRSERGGQLRQTDLGWELQTRDARYMWRPTPGSDNRKVQQLSLETVTALSNAVGRQLDQVVGAAFLAERAATLGSLDGLERAYQGIINHKDMNASVADPWLTKPSSLNLSSFVPTDAAGKVRGFTQRGLSAVEDRYGKELWVHHSIAILPPITPQLILVLHEYGHDFNRNGCFDEPGHNKFMLPVLSDGRVVALTYLEYTPDRRDGTPMLSVGSYVAAADRRTAPPAARSK